MQEIKDYVDKLKKKFPTELRHVSSERILYSSFSRKNSRALAKIGPIPSSLSKFLAGYDYQIQVHLEGWEDSNE